ncbi:GerMN domain-containing protein [Ruminiclostridium cellulolyticum]|uniref:GerMN domain-containing protein n=1 Tax=Ruminiclostridium cellulolyticum (strain ATCC 35319 / DSM 5812 / JCM 6584 / H10) TaxID=394503 RepID=B8I624_RUMCH|nr:GerMN domain-containing protein [Ruminiclostridium cellulolyticum]ACL76789.1 hypothetical protein Ccel_2460 [Ruminiclostridium cellulolyticum H10]
MNNSKKLKTIVAVLFCFIVILVALLVYAVGRSKEPSESSSTPSNSSMTASQTTESQKTASQTTAAKTTSVNETLELKLYYYDADDYEKPKEIRNITLDKKLYETDMTSAINNVLSSTDIKINKAVLDGKKITIDLPKETVKKFNSGSAGGITHTNILAMTVLNLPGVEQMQVTVDGEAGIESDHFSFNGTFIKPEEGKKYTFSPSDNPGKTLEFN